MLFTTGLLMSAPAVWGKLPTHADYVSYNNQSDHAQQWQNWLATHATDYVASSVQRHIPSSTQKFLGWTHLGVQHAKAVLHRLPVSFILPPGQLAFSGDRYIVGVLIASQDAIGRQHPMLSYGLASKQWLAKYWNLSSHVTQDWQYWLGRWLLHVQYLAQEQAHQHEEQDQLYGIHNIDIHRLLVKGLMALWRIHEPKFLMRFVDASSNRPLAKESELALEKVLTAHQLPHKLSFPIPPHLLKGVTHIPWIDWPERILESAEPSPAYWQQDGLGLYINAGAQLAMFYKAWVL